MPPAGLLDGASLLLDFDGTMVDLAPRPDLVHVDDAMRALVRALCRRLDNRVAFVSGRDAATLRGLLQLDGIAIAGSHGLEIVHADGRVDRPERSPALDVALSRFRTYVADHPGVVVEDKPFGAGLHYRQAPQEGAAANTFARAVAADTGLEIQTGHAMIELRLRGGDKGTAIERLMADAPFAAGTPVFLGDDDTDEPGFAATERMGGEGILVGANRASAARWRLPGVAAVRDWLAMEARA